MKTVFDLYCKPLVDVNDAPKGFHPVSINTVLAPNSNENKCNHCDWRKNCSATICSCMSYKRKDGVGVVFKKGV